MREKKEEIIPKLPYGQGTISWMPDGETLIYKKSIQGKRYSVYGATVKEVMKRMNDLEKETNRAFARKEATTLASSMYDWLEKYKKPKLKKTSYDTLRKTIASRIDGCDIGSTRLSAVDSDMIQTHINELNEVQHLSYSTIKKCYDALNDFYRNQTLQGKVARNPMLAVEMVNRENIIKAKKEIKFFEEEDIEKFVAQGSVMQRWSKKPKYQYGFCLCANIYLGMRAGDEHVIIRLKLDKPSKYAGLS